MARSVLPEPRPYAWFPAGVGFRGARRPRPRRSWPYRGDDGLVGRLGGDRRRGQDGQRGRRGVRLAAALPTRQRYWPASLDWTLAIGNVGVFAAATDRRR